MKEVDAYCDYGLGDSIINFIFFYKLKDYIEENNIQINYHCHEKHHNNLKNFNCSKNIKILPFEETGHCLWQGTEDLHSGKYIEDILCDMFNKFLKENDVPITLDKFEYQDQDLLDRYEKLDKKYKNLDILIINSIPNSSQFSYDKSEFDNLIIELNKKYKVATSLRVNNEILALDDFSVKDIAAAATHCNKIIAINTGPSVAMYNTDILDNIDSFYILDTTTHYKFKTRKFVKCNKLSDLSFLLDDTRENFVSNSDYRFDFKYTLMFFLLLLFFGFIVIVYFYFKKIKSLFLHKLKKNKKLFN
jgi:hypothetical protein